MSEKTATPFVHVVQRAAIAPGKLVAIRLAAILLARMVHWGGVGTWQGRQERGEKGAGEETWSV